MRHLLQGRSAAALVLFLLTGMLAASGPGASAQIPEDYPELRISREKNVAYHPVAVPKPKLNPNPRNKRIPYDGKKISLQVSNVGRESAEPTIGVLKNGWAFYAAGSFDGPFGLANTRILRSKDGGQTWQFVTDDLPSGGDPNTTLDPYVYVEEDFGRVFSIDLLLSCSYILFSDDKGDSFQPSSTCFGGDLVNDHQTVVAGPKPKGFSIPGPGLPTDFKEVLYYCYNKIAEAACSRSFDGALTWQRTGAPAFPGFDPRAGGLCGGLHGHIKTDSEGRLFLPKGHCNKPWIAISENAGTDWKQVEITKGINLHAGFNHTSMAVDSEDNLYYVWWSFKRRLPYLSISKDHGKTWGTPRMIAPPGVHEVNIPTITAGDAGRIAITFPGGTTNDIEGDDEGRPWNYYVVMSTNALSKNPTFVSTTANPKSDPIHRGDCGNNNQNPAGSGRCKGMFDFLDVLTSPADGDMWATAVDTCVGPCVTDPAAPPDAAVGLAIRQLGGPRLVKP